MFKQHLEMIGRNETPSKKAKFWQSYIRSLKGSEDIRAQDTPKARSSYRPLSSLPEFSPSFTRSIYDEPNTAGERITSPGYRYQPVHRETYGYSPRPIYAHNYNRSINDSKPYDADKAWNEHLQRMADIDKRYPSRYGLYLKDKPTALVPLEYEPETKPFSSGPNPVDAVHAARGSSLPPFYNRASSMPPFMGGSIFDEPMLERGRSRTRSPSPGFFEPSRRMRASSLEPFEEYLRRYDNCPRQRFRSASPTPVKYGRWGPRPSEVAFDYDGLPIFSNGGLNRRNFANLMNPSPSMPISAVTRDPWWYNLPDLRPLSIPYLYARSPFFLRNSYLSPVKNTYLWNKHPFRSLVHVY